VRFAAGADQVAVVQHFATKEYFELTATLIPLRNSFPRL
jgi:hypothetical protein